MDEKLMVFELGDHIGYGRVMQLAEQCWRERIEPQGLAGGEHSVGPCVAFLVRCPCNAPVKCDWCCGSGRVTARVCGGLARGRDRSVARTRRSKARTQPVPRGSNP